MPMNEENVYDFNSLPTDFEVFSTQMEFEPLPADTYQVEILKVEIKDNPFYKPDAKDGKTGFKYQISTTLAVIDDGEFYGRRLWKNFTPVMKPTSKKGPTLLYKFITAVLNTPMNWDDCASYTAQDKFGKNVMELKNKQLRVGVEIVEKDGGSKKNAVNSFFAVKKELPPFDEEKSKKMGEDKRSKK